MYTEKVMDHFEHPRNVGEIENASGMGTVGNPKCGDIMRIYLDIDENQIIRDVKFKTFGLSLIHIFREWCGLIQRDYSHPCIVVWNVLNESWGIPAVSHDPEQQAFANAMYLSLIHIFSMASTFWKKVMEVLPRPFNTLPRVVARYMKGQSQARMVMKVPASGSRKTLTPSWLPNMVKTPMQRTPM